MFKELGGNVRFMAEFPGQRQARSTPWRRVVPSLGDEDGPWTADQVERCTEPSGRLI